MRIQLINKPRFGLYTWAEFGAGLSVIVGVGFSFIPF